MSVHRDDQVIVGYTTESGHSAGSYGIFDPNITPRFGATDSGTVQYDKVRQPRSLGHAFELRQAINREPKNGTKGQLARTAFNSHWSEPKVERSQGWKQVAAAR